MAVACSVFFDALVKWVIFAFVLFFVVAQSATVNLHDLQIAIRRLNHHEKQEICKNEDLVLNSQN